MAKNDGKDGRQLKMSKKAGYRIRYASSRGKGIVVWLPYDPRKHKCEACGKVVGIDIKMTALHHWWYAYQPKTVRENPMLALENTSEVCYYCHELADAIRALLYAHPKRVAQVAILLKGEPRERFINVLKQLIVLLTNAEDTELAKKLLEMAKSG